jgi:hypothetical protein
MDFNFALVYGTTKGQQSQERPEMNGTRQLLVCANEVNVLSEYIQIINRNIKAPLDVSSEVGLDENSEKTKYMKVSRHQKEGQSHNLMTENKTLENVTKVICLGMTVTNKNYIHKDTKEQIKFGECLLPSV